MNVKKPLVIMAAVAGTFVLCQCSSEAPPPPGTVRMVDQKAISLMQEARGKEEKNDLSGAIKKYKRVVEKHPLSREAPQARFRMAELYEARKDPAEAFDQYQKLIDLIGLPLHCIIDRDFSGIIIGSAGRKNGHCHGKYHDYRQ